MIRIYNLSRVYLDIISQELETERWYTTLWSHGEKDYVSVELYKNVIFKCWDDECMIDLGGKKTFFHSEDFERIEIF